MTNIILSGCCGKMGRVIANSVINREDCKIIAGVDLFGEKYCNFPVYKTFSEVEEKGDVIIDFSHPSLLTDLLEYAVSTGTAAVVATTGLNDNHVAQLRKAAESVAIFFSYNMSLGVNLLADLAKKAAAVLSEDFDIEIVEAHHNQKIDAPSGTALMLADEITSVIEQPYNYEYDRHSKHQKRPKREIGLHAVRGGNIVGEHEIIFAGHDEIIKISHSARSKEIFGTGAINAALFLDGKSAGMYSMTDLVKSK